MRLGSISIFFLCLFTWVGCAPALVSGAHTLLGTQITPVTAPRAEPVNQGTSLTFPARGEVTLVYFWGSFCPNCMKRLPELETILSKFKGLPVTFIGVSIDLDLENAVMAINKLNVSFPMVWDGSEDARRAFGTRSVAPRLFLLDKNGKMVLFLKGKASKSKDEKARLEMIERAVHHLLGKH